jgi:GT2 family glycosyltransferase
LIPSRDNPRLLAQAVKSSLEAVPAVREVLVLENGSKRPETLALYRQIGQIDRVHVLDYGIRPFNYSLINNWGALKAKGNALLFLNDDAYARSSDWLKEMAQWLTDRRVGAVGARLVYPDGYLQHNGVVLGMGGLAGHRSQGASDQQEVALDKTSGDARDVSAATAACLLIRTTAFREVGGFDEAFPLAFGDVDLCLRLQKRGYQIVCTPDARLVHEESATRGSDLEADKLSAFLEATRLMRSRWAAELDADPFYNRNLTLNESLPRIRMT